MSRQQDRNKDKTKEYALAAGAVFIRVELEKFTIQIVKSKRAKHV